MTRENKNRKITLMLSFTAVVILAIATAFFGLTGTVSAKAVELTSYVNNGELTTDVKQPNEVTELKFMTAVENNRTEGEELINMMKDADGNILPTKSENGTEYSGVFTYNGEDYDYDVVLRMTSGDNHQPYGQNIVFELDGQNMIEYVKKMYDDDVISRGYYAFATYIAKSEGEAAVAWDSGRTTSHLNWINFDYAEREVETVYMLGHLYNARIGQGGEYVGTLRILVDIVESNNTEYSIAPTAVTAVEPHLARVGYDFAALDMSQESKNALESNQWNSVHINTDTPAFRENIQFKFNGQSEFANIVEQNTADGGAQIAVNIRANGIEMARYTQGENASTVAFAQGDRMLLKAGMQLPYYVPQDGVGYWTNYGQAGFRFLVLDKDMEFEFDGEKWSVEVNTVAGVAFENDTESVAFDGSLKLEASAIAGPDVASADKTVVYTSSDENVATVAADGTLTLKAVGTTTVTATLGSFTDTCEVTVTTALADIINSVSVDKENVSIVAGNTETIVATIDGGANTVAAGVTWSSSDTSVATVENGVITAVAEGSATITVTSVADNTKTATVTVTVTAASTGGDDDDEPVTPPTGGDDDNEPVTPPAEDNKGDDNKSDSGCGSSVAGTSAMAGLMLVAIGATVLVSKKRKA